MVVAISVAATVPVYESMGQNARDTSGMTVVIVEGVADTVSYGLELYRQQYCGLCHAMARASTSGIFGPSHDGMATIAAERLRDPAYAGGAQSIEEYLRESITHPDEYVVPGFEATVHRMPSYAHLPSSDIDAIVRFLLEKSCASGDECVGTSTMEKPGE